MLTSLVNKKDSTTYSTYSYNYNLDGNINRKVESGKATDYVYDGTGRLSNEKITNGSAVTNMTYAYDNAGNRSSLTVTGTENYVTTYSYDKNNRLLKDSKKNNGASYADVTLYSYDNNGNQIRKDQSRDDLTGKPKMGFSLATANSGYGYEKFTYNGFNQLTAFEDEAGNKATYEYYSDGLRLSKTVNGAKSSYIWADNDLAMEIKSDEVISYAKAPGYMRTGSSNDRTYRNDKLYLFNGHGDVTSMIDKSGNVTKTYSYDAFGNELNRDKNDTNPFRYCGEYWDNETESIYLRARYYNPSIGRFTTEDPIKDGSNWYAYCGGNPVGFIDPNGFYEVTSQNVVEGLQGTVLVNPINVKKILDLAEDSSYEATLKAQEWGFGNTTWDNKVDAYRHFIWNYKATKEVGFINTCVFMDRHEDKEQIYVGKNKEGNPCYLTPIASLMDINNNQYGRNMAQFGDYESADDAFNDALENGYLLLSLEETKKFYDIPNTWIYGANDKRYNNKYVSVIIEGKISDIGGIPNNVKLVNPSDIKK